MTVLVRPSVICFNPNNIQAGGVLVTPHQTGVDPSSGMQEPIINEMAVRAALGSQVNSIVYRCMPKGRFQVNVVWPTGQAWTTPNEAGSCATTEGTTDFTNLTCPIKPRPILYSQGNRAILEIIDPVDPSYCQMNSVPPQCCPNGAVNPSTGLCCPSGGC